MMIILLPFSKLILTKHWHNMCLFFLVSICVPVLPAVLHHVLSFSLNTDHHLPQWHDHFSITFIRVLFLSITLVFILIFIDPFYHPYLLLMNLMNLFFTCHFRDLTFMHQSTHTLVTSHTIWALHWTFIHATISNFDSHLFCMHSVLVEMSTGVWVLDCPLRVLFWKDWESVKMWWCTTWTHSVNMWLRVNYDGECR